MSIVSSGSKLAVARILSTAVGFIGLAAFSQEFGGEILGPFFLFQAIITIISIPGDVGIRGAVEKRISEGQPAGEVVTSSFLIKLPLLVVFSLVVLFFRGPINQYLGSNLAVLVCVGLFLRESALLVIAILRGELRVGETASLRLLRNVSWVAIGIILSKSGSGVRGPIYGLLFGFLLMTVIGVIRIDTGLAKPSRTTLHSLVGYGKYKTVSNASWEIFNWTDILIIGAFYGSTIVAAYEIAWRVSMSTLIISSTAIRTVFPHASRDASLGNTEKLQEYVRYLLLIMSVVLIPAFFGTLAVGREILVVAFSPEFEIASLALVILVFQSIVQSIQSAFGQMLFALDRPRLPTTATVIAFSLNLVFNVLLIPPFGLVGAAIATTTAYFVNFVIQYVYITDFVSIDPPWRIVIVSLISSTLMYLTLESIKTRFAISSFASLFGIILSGIFIYAAISITSASVRNELKEYVRSFR